MHNTFIETNPAELPSPSSKERMLAWGAHLFTATGALWAILTVLAIIDQEWKIAFVWMTAAVVVDSFDGFIARAVRVKEVLPEFDGELMDNILDYVTYVFVPAFLLIQAGLFPANLSLIGAAIILLTSAYQFCQVDAKTDDHYFKGFPSYWNVLAFYLVIFGFAPWVNFVIVAVFGILVFVPIKYVYPSRTTRLRGLTMSLLGVWAICTVILWYQFPDYNRWLIIISSAVGIYYLGLSLYATFTDGKTA